VTASTLVRCSFCQDQRPLSDVFEPYRGAVRCRDVAACERRQIRAFDPTIPPDEDRPRPLGPQAGPPGTACGYCRASDPPGGLHQRTPGVWFCLDRAACEQRSVDVLYLTAWSDSSPDRMISAADMRAMTSAAGAQIPPEPSRHDPDALAVEAWRSAAGRQRG
jgi:hypothetical protein